MFDCITSRLLVVLVLIVPAATSVFAQESRERGEIHAIGDPAPLRSFKALCDRAAVIIEGVVESDSSRLMPSMGMPHVETDFQLAVSRVIKGSLDTSRIVVSEMGGTFGDLHLIMNFPLLKQGDRYILFLYADKRADFPPVPGLPRFQADIFYGTFRVDAGKIQPFFRDHFKGKYTGLSSDAFVAEIGFQLSPAR
jgi:hypothetical protein